MTPAGERSNGFPISAWAIRNPVPVVVLFIALVLAGMIAYTGLPIKQFPNVEFPVVTVTVTQSGAAPGEMETQITRPIEDALSGLEGVRNVTSSVTLGASTTAIEFEIGEDLQKKVDDVRQRIDQTRAILPREIDPPTVQRVEISSAPILTYAATAPGMSDADLYSPWLVDDTIARGLQAEPGVAQISRVGGVNREINILVDPSRLAARKLTAAEVSQALQGFDLDAAGGRVSVGGREQTLRVLGSVKTLAALRDLNIPTGGGHFVKLTDVADVGDGASEVRGFALLNDRPVVGFQVSKTKDSSDVDVDDSVTKGLAKLEKSHPGLKFTKIFSSVDETRASFHATQHVLLEGMFLAALVVFLFLRDWRSTMITAFAMPISLIPTFFVMHLFGFSLNLVTLLALTLVIGILVDDAIVEIENIEKRVATGMRPYQAAMEGADAIGLAVVATTMAIVVVFTPVSFMKGMAGQFFREFGLTVSVAVLFSLLVARLLTPLMAAYLLKPSKNPHPRKPFKGFYRNALEWALDHRIVASIVGGVIFFASIALVPLLPTGFQPAGNPDYLYVKIQGPPGASVTAMQDAVQRINTLMRKQPGSPQHLRPGEVHGGHRRHGRLRRGGGGSPAGGTITVLLDPDRRASDDDIKRRLRGDLRNIPDVRAGFLDFQGAAGYQQILASDDPKALDAAALELEKEMRTLPSLADVHPSSPPVGPEVIIRPRLDEAARLGVPVQTIAQIARIATVGDIDANVAKLDEGERRIPIRVRLPADARADVAQLKALRVPTGNGGVTTLDAVADIQFQAGPTTVNRLNRKRQVTINAELNGVELGQAAKAISNLPIMKHLPPGVGPADIGQQQAFKELMSSFGLAIFAGVSMIYGVLVLLFGSFFKPGVILSALPLAVGGAFLGLLIFNLSLSVPSLIGFLMLLGLAAKNSILLVEYAIERERDGMSQREALLEACRERARPIDRHDHHGHDGRHAAHGAGPGEGRGVPPAHGRRCDRRSDDVHRAVPGAGAGGL